MPEVSAGNSIKDRDYPGLLFFVFTSIMNIPQLEETRKTHLKTLDGHIEKIHTLVTTWPNVLTPSQYTWLLEQRKCIAWARHPVGMRERVLHVAQLLGWLLLQLKNEHLSYKELAHVIDVNKEYIRVLCLSEQGRRDNIAALKKMSVIERRPWEW